jgi:hypothetical protein
MRPFAEQLYGIPPERVIGSALGLEVQAEDAVTDLLYKSKIEFFDDGPEKPVRIWSRIGRRPLLACGNSNGDIPMLRFANRPDRSGLRLIVLHDDADREFDYVDGCRGRAGPGEGKVLDGAERGQRLGARVRLHLMCTQPQLRSRPRRVVAAGWSGDRTWLPIRKECGACPTVSRTFSSSGVTTSGSPT